MKFHFKHENTSIEIYSLFKEVDDNRFLSRVFADFICLQTPREDTKEYVRPVRSSSSSQIVTISKKSLIRSDHRFCIRGIAQAVRIDKIFVDQT